MSSINENPLNLNTQIAIVSIFGRGHWLSVELAKLGVSVSLLDLTPQMGRWAPEDGEGPFGFFKSGALRESQMERLLEDDPPILVSSGFTIWLKDGPLELKGATSALRLKTWGINPLATDYVSGKKGPGNALKKLSFAETWIAHLSHSFSSVISSLLPESASVSLRRDLFSSFMIRQTTRMGLEKSFKWCESHGVKVYRQTEIKDLSFRDRSRLDGFEAKVDRPGLYRAEKFVWCLSAEETGMLGTPVQSSLFPQGAVEPEWVWVRYRLRLRVKTQSNVLSLLPQHCVVISDLNLNWVNENMITLQRTAVADSFDAWIRIANTHRFQKQYLEGKGEQICRILESKVPELEAQVSELPMEAELTFSQLGPSRHPLYARGQREAKSARKLDNVHFDSPQVWESLGWEGAFQNQEKIFQELEAWWVGREELRKKKEAKLQSKAKSRGADL